MSFTLTVEMNQKQCAECGIVYCIPTWFDDKCKEGGRSWLCPNGHHRSYGQSADQKKITELSALLASEKRSRVECEAKLRATVGKPGDAPKARGRGSHRWTPEQRAEASRRQTEYQRLRREGKAK